MADIGIIAQILAICCFFLSVIFSRWTMVYIKILSIIGFAAGLYFFDAVKTDVGMLCSVIIMQVSVITLVLAQVANHVLVIRDKDAGDRGIWRRIRAWMDDNIR